MQELLVLYVDRKLTSKEMEKVKAHLESCNECAANLEKYKKTIDLIKTLPMKEAPVGLCDEIKRNLNQADIEKRSFLPFPTVKILVPAFAVLLIAIGVIYFFTKRQISEVPSYTKIEKEKISILARKEKIEKAMAKKDKELESTKAKEEIIKAKPIQLVKVTEELPPVFFRGAAISKEGKKFIKEWKGIHSGFKEENSFIIKNQKDWKKIWKIHTKDIKPTLPVPEIDFTRSIVVAVFMGDRKTSGYEVEILDIEEVKDKVIIKIRETTPPEDAFVSQVIIQPFHIAVVKKTL